MKKGPELTPLKQAIVHQSQGPNKNPVHRPSGNEWNDLEAIYLHCASVTASPAAVLPYMRNRPLLNYVKKPKELEALAEVLSKDAKEYNERLVQIHMRHKGRTGGLTHADNIMAVFEIQEAYNAWLLSYESVVVSNTLTVMKIFEEAAIAQEQAESKKPNSI